MGKRRVGFKKPKNPIDKLQNAGSSDEEGQLDAILEDEIDRYNSMKDDALLQKGKKADKAGSESDDEQEVYGLKLEESDDEEDGFHGPTFDSEDDMDVDGPEEEDEDDEGDDDDNDEDILGKRSTGEGYLPDSRAWGKKAGIFHSTDYVDQDFGKMEGEDAEKALLEEEEAKAIQKRLTAELDESDFLDFLPAKKEPSQKKKDFGKEYLKLDIDSLSEAEKRKLVERECPEVPHLLEEQKEKMQELLVLKEKMRKETRPVVKNYFETKFHLLSNYCINIAFFLYNRSTQGQNSAGHPSIKRILQYRKLIDELKVIDVKKIAAASEITPKLIPEEKPKKLLRGILKSTADASSTPIEPEIEAEDEPEKRHITYEMAKNKGLMPKRKKEQRNPRVKHKEKFRKATIRRKGQVRKPRTETVRYGGELSGIKTHVTKSIKLK